MEKFGYLRGTIAATSGAVGSVITSTSKGYSSIRNLVPLTIMFDLRTKGRLYYSYVCRRMMQG